MNTVSRLLIREQYLRLIADLMSGCVLVDMAHEDDVKRARRVESLKQVLAVTEKFRREYAPDEVLDFEKLRGRVMERIEPKQEDA